MNNSLYEVELAKAQIETKEPITVGSLTLQYAKRRMLELYSTSSPNSVMQPCSKFWKWTQIRSILLLPRKNLKVVKRPEVRAELQRMRSNDRVDTLSADAVASFFPRTYCIKHKQHDEREPGHFKEEFRCTVMLYLCSKTYCCHEVTRNKTNFSSKGLKNRVLEQSAGDGPLENYRRVLNERTNVTSLKRELRTTNHSVATKEQFKKICPTTIQSG